MDDDPFSNLTLKNHSELSSTEYDEENDVYRLVYSTPDEKRLEGRGFIDTMGEYVPKEDELVLEFSNAAEAAEYHFQEFESNRNHPTDSADSKEIDLLVSSIHEIARQKMKGDSEDLDFFSLGRDHLEDRITNEKIDLIDLADGTTPKNAMFTEEMLEDVMERYAERLSKEIIARNYDPKDSGIVVEYDPSKEFHDLTLEPEEIPDVDDIWDQ